MRLPLGRTTAKVVIEDPEALGYWLAEDPLLAVMEIREWEALEDAALRSADERRR